MGATVKTPRFWAPWAWDLILMHAIEARSLRERARMLRAYDLVGDAMDAERYARAYEQLVRDALSNPSFLDFEL